MLVLLLFGAIVAALAVWALNQRSNAERQAEAALPAADALGCRTAASKAMRFADLDQFRGDEVDQTAARRAAPVLLPFAGALHLGADR